MKRQDALDALREGGGQPFAMSCVPNPWDLRTEDVEEIHAHVVEGLLRLVQIQANDPQAALSALVIGEVGSGKTHVLARLWARARQRRIEYLFASVPPLIDPNRPLQHLQYEILASLLREPEEGRGSQLDCLLARLVQGYVAERWGGARTEPAAEALRAAEALSKDPSKLRRLVKPRPRAKSAARERTDTWRKTFPLFARWIQTRHPGQTWGTCLRVLFQYPDPEKRALVMRWLQWDRLDDDELELLGLRHDPAQETEAGAEDRAARVLATLGALLTDDRPLLVCFDQLENLDTPERVRAFGQTVMTLFNRVHSSLILCCVRGDWWQSHKHHLDAAVASRLEANPFELLGCTAGQGESLIRARLAALAHPEGWTREGLFPFDEEPTRGQLAGWLREGRHTARQVLQMANHHWAQVVLGTPPDDQSDDPLETLREWFLNRCRQIGPRAGSHPPDPARLVEGLRLFVELRPLTQDSRVLSLSAAGRPREPRILEIETPTGVRRIGLIGNVHSNSSSLRASLRKLQNLLTGDGGGGADRADGAVLVRDGRVPFRGPAQWKTTNRMKDEFRSRGGVVLDLSWEEVSRLYALVALHQAVLAGDIGCRIPQGRDRRLGMSDFRRFVLALDTGPGLGELLDYLAARAGHAVALPSRRGPRTASRGARGKARGAQPPAQAQAQAQEQTQAQAQAQAQVQAQAQAQEQAQAQGQGQGQTQAPAQGPGRRTAASSSRSAKGGGVPARRESKDTAADIRAQVHMQLRERPASMAVARELHDALETRSRRKVDYDTFLEIVRRDDTLEVFEARDESVVKAKVPG